MPRTSAGLLMYRRCEDRLEVLLAHPGGPFFANRDLGAWSIPKGEFGPDEEPLAAARREFTEETGIVVAGPFLELGTIRQKGGKVVHGWAVEGECDPATIVCNTITIEWPPRSGRRIEIPEIDCVEWFDLETAAKRINVAQIAFLETLAREISA